MQYKQVLVKHISMEGMMGEPFYSSDMDVEEMYASIGAFWVGHEVSHAFDLVIHQPEHYFGRKALTEYIHNLY